MILGVSAIAISPSSYIHMGIKRKSYYCFFGPLYSRDEFVKTLERKGEGSRV